MHSIWNAFLLGEAAIACALPLLVTRLTVGNQHDHTQDRIPQFQTSADLDPRLSSAGFLLQNFQIFIFLLQRERERAWEHECDHMPWLACGCGSPRTAFPSHSHSFLSFHHGGTTQFIWPSSKNAYLLKHFVCLKHASRLKALAAKESTKVSV